LTFNEYLTNLRGKRVAVAGAGISNTPLIEALLASGADVKVRDKRTRTELGEAAGRFEGRGARLLLGEGYLDKLDEEIIFRTPGLMPSHPALQAAIANGALLTSEMEVFFDVCPCRIIGVTGSDGKTTTASIIAEMLKNANVTAHIGGNIGEPLLCRADMFSPDDIAVLELSSFQLITMKKSPDIAVVTNLSPNHLDIHANMEEYIAAKQNIYKRQDASGMAIFNYDNGFTRSFAAEAPGRPVLFSRREKLNDGVYFDGGTIYSAACGRSEAVLEAGEILLPGLHIIENYMAAIAAVQGFAGRGAILGTAGSFRGVPHRIELVREHGGVKYYNDSIASSPSRTIAGLNSFENKVILIAGGKDKGVAFDQLGEEIVKHVKRLILTGLTAAKIKEAVISAAGYNGEPEIIMYEDFSDAVRAAAGAAAGGDVVLLSPACTSFDRFRNFEERGDLFREIISSLE